MCRDNGREMRLKNNDIGSQQVGHELGFSLLQCELGTVLENTTLKLFELGRGTQDLREGGSNFKEKKDNS